MDVFQGLGFFTQRAYPTLDILSHNYRFFPCMLHGPITVDERRISSQ